jgi:hypothetical protein
VAEFLIGVLTDLGPGRRVPMPELVRAAAARDRILAPAIFFKPEAVPQYKSVL